VNTPLPWQGQEEDQSVWGNDVDRKKGTTNAPSKASPDFVQIQRAFLRDPTLKPEDKLVGCLMASYANSEGLAWPGGKRVARESGLGRNKANRGRARLVAREYLRIHQERVGQARFGASRYEVTEKILYRKPRGANENAPSDRVHDARARGRKPRQKSAS
jgi:hypothetical protein